MQTKSRLNNVLRIFAADMSSPLHKRWLDMYEQKYGELLTEPGKQAFDRAAQGWVSHLKSGWEIEDDNEVVDTLNQYTPEEFDESSVIVDNIYSGIHSTEELARQQVSKTPLEQTTKVPTSSKSSYTKGLAWVYERAEQIVGPGNYETYVDEIEQAIENHLESFLSVQDISLLGSDPSYRTRKDKELVSWLRDIVKEYTPVELQTKQETQREVQEQTNLEPLQALLKVALEELGEGLFERYKAKITEGSEMLIKHFCSLGAIAYPFKSTKDRVDILKKVLDKGVQEQFKLRLLTPLKAQAPEGYDLGKEFRGALEKYYKLFGDTRVMSFQEWYEKHSGELSKELEKQINETTAEELVGELIRIQRGQSTKHANTIKDLVNTLLLQDRVERETAFTSSNPTGLELPEDHEITLKNNITQQAHEALVAAGFNEQDLDLIDAQIEFLIVIPTLEEIQTSHLKIDNPKEPGTPVLLSRSPEAQTSISATLNASASTLADTKLKFFFKDLVSKFVENPPRGLQRRSKERAQSRARDLSLTLLESFLQNYPTYYAQNRADFETQGWSDNMNSAKTVYISKLAEQVIEKELSSGKTYDDLVSKLSEKVTRDQMESDLLGLVLQQAESAPFQVEQEVSQSSDGWRLEDFQQLPVQVDTPSQMRSMIIREKEREYKTGKFSSTTKKFVEDKLKQVFISAGLGTEEDWKRIAARPERMFNQIARDLIKKEKPLLEWIQESSGDKQINPNDPFGKSIQVNPDVVEEIPLEEVSQDLLRQLVKFQYNRKTGGSTDQWSQIGKEKDGLAKQEKAIETFKEGVRKRGGTIPIQWSSPLGRQLQNDAAVITQLQETNKTKYSSWIDGFVPARADELRKQIAKQEISTSPDLLNKINKPVYLQYTGKITIDWDQLGVPVANRKTGLWTEQDFSYNGLNFNSIESKVKKLIGERAKQTKGELSEQWFDSEQYSGNYPIPGGTQSDALSAGKSQGETALKVRYLPAGTEKKEDDNLVSLESQGAKLNPKSEQKLKQQYEQAITRRQELEALDLELEALKKELTELKKREQVGDPIKERQQRVVRLRKSVESKYKTVARRKKYLEFIQKRIGDQKLFDLFLPSGELDLTKLYLERKGTKKEAFNLLRRMFADAKKSAAQTLKVPFSSELDLESISWTPEEGWLANRQGLSREFVVVEYTDAPVTGSGYESVVEPYKI